MVSHPTPVHPDPKCKDADQKHYRKKKEEKTQREDKSAENVEGRVMK